MAALNARVTQAAATALYCAFVTVFANMDGQNGICHRKNFVGNMPV